MGNVTTAHNSTEEKALNLLGAGIEIAVVASACGVSPSRISQLLSEDTFKEKLVELRYKNLQKHNERDTTLDEIETDLANRLKEVTPLLHKPMEIARVLHTINSCKRRGQSAPESVTQQQNVVNLVMPVQVIERFTVNVNNQVISAGKQDLLTIPAGNLAGLAARAKDATIVPAIENRSNSHVQSGSTRSTENSPASRAAREEISVSDL